jgi:callose synthase
MRGGAISYQEFIHVGKGRDMGFIAINGFEQKISAGNALQCSSRELYRIGKFFDVFRLMSFYFTGAGFFLTNRMTTGIIYALCVTRLAMALFNSEELQVTFYENGGVADGRRLTELGASQLGLVQAYNSSIGLEGQLTSALASVEASWVTGYNDTGPGEADGTWKVQAYESSFGIVQVRAASRRVAAPPGARACA